MKLSSLLHGGSFFDPEDRGDMFLQHMGRKTKLYIKLRGYSSFTWRVGGKCVCVIDDEEKQ
jgi:hypothetical protein